MLWLIAFILFPLLALAAFTIVAVWLMLALVWVAFRVAVAITLGIAALVLSAKAPQDDAGWQPSPRKRDPGSPD